MRLFSVPPPTLLAGFLAVLIGYASSAAIIWQAAIVAGATTAQISGWMTALGLAMGVSTLTLTLWYRVPVLTAWSTPGAALLVTGLQGLTLNEAIGVFIVTNALIVLCGITGLFARLMRIIPHSLAAAMLAGILLRFGLQAFASLDGQFTKQRQRRKRCHTDTLRRQSAEQMAHDRVAGNRQPTDIFCSARFLF